MVTCVVEVYLICVHLGLGGDDFIYLVQNVVRGSTYVLFIYIFIPLPDSGPSLRAGFLLAKGLFLSP
jgi:hypothetical protein